MQGNCTKFLLNLVIMLAFIGAGISPACKFISGQMVEICGPNGIETVRLSADQLPREAPDHRKQAGDPCAFCFAGSHIKTDTPSPVIIALPDPALIAAERAIESIQAYSLYRSATLPRGPPATV